MLSIASYFTQNKVCTRNPRHSLSIDIKFQNNDIKTNDIKVKHNEIKGRPFILLNKCVKN